MTKIELVKATVIELKPECKYIIALDERMVTHEDAHNMLLYLNEVGITDAIVAMFRGDPSNGLKIIEQKPHANNFNRSN